MSTATPAKQAAEPEEEHDRHEDAEATEPKKKEEAKKGGNLKVIEGGKKGKKSGNDELVKKPNLKVVQHEGKQEEKKEDHAKHDENKDHGKEGHGFNVKDALGSVSESAWNGVLTVGKSVGSIAAFFGRRIKAATAGIWYASVDQVRQEYREIKQYVKAPSPAPERSLTPSGIMEMTADSIAGVFGGVGFGLGMPFRAGGRAIRGVASSAIGLITGKSIYDKMKGGKIKGETSAEDDQNGEAHAA